MSRLVRKIPEGDDRERLVCPDCDYIAYENPKIIVGSVIGEGDRVLLCRRAIEPRAGLWTMPAGYMEVNETVVEGAQREAWEEARARIAIDGVLAVYSIARLSQVQIISAPAGPSQDSSPVLRASRSGGSTGPRSRGTTLPFLPSAGHRMPGTRPGMDLCHRPHCQRKIVAESCRYRDKSP